MVGLSTISFALQKEGGQKDAVPIPNANWRVESKTVAKSLYFVFNFFTLNTKLKYWRTSLNALTFRLVENPHYV